MTPHYELLKYGLTRGWAIMRKNPTHYLLIVALYFMLLVSLNSIYDYFFLTSEEQTNDYFNLIWINDIIHCCLSAFFVSTLLYNLHAVEAWKTTTKPSFLTIIRESGFKYWLYFSIFDFVFRSILGVCLSLTIRFIYEYNELMRMFLWGFNYMRYSLFAAITIICAFVPFFTIIERLPLLPAIKKSLRYIKSHLLFFVVAGVGYYVFCSPIESFFLLKNNTSFSQYLEFYHVSFSRPFGMSYYLFLIFSYTFFACFSYAIYERFVLQKDTFLEEKISEIGSE